MLKVRKNTAILTAAVRVMVESRSDCSSCVNEMIPGNVKTFVKINLCPCVNLIVVGVRGANA
jgi:hypothetical protein